MKFKLFYKNSYIIYKIIVNYSVIIILFPFSKYIIHIFVNTNTADDGI